MTRREELVEKIEELQGEITQLRQALVSHAVVDQAIGVVVAVSGLRPEQGWEVLKTVSQRTNTKLRDVALHVVHWPGLGSLPAEIRPALRMALVEAHALHGGRGVVRQEQWCTGYEGVLPRKSE
ncbi:ANTAR domain-containing protein [Streptomyces sp. SID13726]|uniref:ANTAR domain-containing protein n=1 Tax=Streptomyces sp. SID13726 TaxID=2706058 RepID=UPI0013B7FDDE|nr:ANTAR domain-containing protein [Streptomyces sp. SID13726]NEB04036.1 ANTAR domain-containing protein [Streptomyces sp. SID13726]